MQAKNTWKKFLYLIATFSLMLFALTGCQEDDVKSASAVAKKLAKANVSEVTLEDTVELDETIVIEGTKTLTGAGIINVAESMEGDYAIVVPEGAELTIDGITINCGKFASAIQVEKGAKLNVRTGTINEGAKHNINNAGTLEVQEGQFLYSGGVNLYNKGTVTIAGGTFAGNGGDSKAVVYNKGEVNMTGGTISEGIACNLYVAKGAVATMDGGTIESSGADGVYIAKGGKFTIKNELAKIASNGNNGVMNYGETIVEDGIFLSNNGNQIENRIGGDLLIKGGQIMSGMIYGVDNRGTMTMTGGSITGSTYCGISNKGTCYVKGGEISFNNFRGISNKTGGKLYVDGNTTFKGNYSSNITNDIAAYAEVKNVTLNGGTSNNIHNRGEFYVENCEFIDSGSNSVNTILGYLEMKNVVIDNNIKNNGIYSTGGEVKLINVEIKNVKSRAIQNAGAKIVAENLIIDNAAKSAVGNKTNPNNGEEGSIEIDNLIIRNPQGVYLNNEGEGSITVKNSKLMKTNKSTAVRIYKGKVTLDNVEFMGTTAPDAKTSIHAIYMTGGILNINNTTIHDTDSRAIQNASGTVVGKNVTIYKTGGTAIGNKAYEGRVGNITIDGLKIRDINPGSTELINECSGTIKVKNGTFGVSTGASAIKINDDAHGKIILENCTLEGTQRKAGDTTSSIHAIYPLSGSMEIRNSVIKNVQSRGIQNKGCEITIDGLTVTNCGGVAVGNEVGDKGQVANITATNLVVKDTQSSSVVNAAPGTVVTVNSSTLHPTPKTNVSASKGTVVLSNTKVLGSSAAKSEKKTALNTDEAGKIIVKGNNSYITNPSFRAVGNKGTFVLEGGTIANAVSQDSAGAVYSPGHFIMSGGSIKNNESNSVGGAVNVIRTGSMVMTGGEISGNKAEKGGAINVEGDATLEITGGVVKGNEATVAPLTNNIQHGGSKFTLGGSAVVQDLYLLGTRSITMASKLTAMSNFIVSLDGASGGREVLNGDNANAIADTASKVTFEPVLASHLYLDVNGVIRSTSTDFEARIGTVYYTTLSEAFMAAPSNGTATTIEVLKNITLSSGITITDGQNIILTDDGAVRTITREDSNVKQRMFTVEGDSQFTVKGSSGNDTDITLIIDGNDDGGATANKDSQIIAVGTGNNADKSKAVVTLCAGAALQNNKVVYGGGLVVYGTFNMEGGIIRNNRSVGDNAGAIGIQTWGRMTMSGGTITGNRADKAGGAIHTKVPEGSGVTRVFDMTGGTIENNTAGTHSGAISAYNEIAVTGGTIQNNVSQNTGNDAGSQGIRMADSKALILGGSAFVDEIWISKNNNQIQIASDLTTAADGSMMVTLEPNNAATLYVAEHQVLYGTKVADNYAKFTLPAGQRVFWTIGSDGKLKGLDADTVAMIGTKEYKTLNDAIAAVPATGEETTIKVIKNIDLGIPAVIPTGKNVVITDDGTARTIKRAATGRMFTVEGTGKLTLKGSSNNDNNITLILDGNDDGANSASTDSQIIAVGTGNNADKSKATVTLCAGVALQNNKCKYGGALVVYGTFDMKGGIIRNNRSVNDNAGAIGIQTWGRMTMSGGSITGNSATNAGGAIHTKVPGTSGVTRVFTMTGGSITNNTAGTHSGAISGYNEISVTGGTIQNNVSKNTGNDAGSQGIRMADSKALILGGSAFVDEIWISKNNNEIQITSDLTAADGSMLVTLEPNNASELYVDGHQVLYGDAVGTSYSKFRLPDSVTTLVIGDDGKLTTDLNQGGGGSSTTPTEVAKIGETPYDTLTAAFAAVPTTGVETTIVLQADVTLTAEDNITLLAGQNVVLTDDGTARTIKRASANKAARLFTVIEGSTLTLRGTGDDKNPTLTLDGQNITNGNDAQLIAVGTGNKKDATVIASTVLNMEKGVVLTKNKTTFGAVVVYGTFNMKGGKITGNTSSGNAGGVAIQNSGVMTMSDGSIDNNTADGHGGGIHINRSSTYPRAGYAFEMTGGSITANTAGTGSKYAGAITAQDKTKITGGVIKDNTAGTTGTNGLRVSNANLEIGGAAQVDAIYLVKGKQIDVISDLTAALDASIVVTLQSGYTGDVLTGSAATTSASKFAF